MKFIMVVLLALQLGTASTWIWIVIIGTSKSALFERLNQDPFIKRNETLRCGIKEV